MSFRLDNLRSRRGGGLVAILRERFTGEQDGLFTSVAGGRRSGMPRAFGALRAAIVKTALLGAAGFETARLLAAIVEAARISAGILWA